MGEYRFELFPRWTLLGKRWYWRLRAGNGEIVAASEGYYNRGDARETVDQIKAKSFEAPVIVLDS